MRIPPLFGDECRNMTVLKYLESHHGIVDDDDCSDSHYFTEHDVHGKQFHLNKKKRFIATCSNSSKTPTRVTTAYATEQSERSI